jgi:CHAT domain-containing protein/tetratricopeptide (TPR) repeat protein
MKYFLYISLLIICSSSFSFGQQNPKDAIASLDSLGVLTYYQEDYGQATYFWEQMKVVIEKNELEQDYLGALQYVATLYLETEKYASSEALYLKIIKLQKELKGTQNLFYIQCIGQLGYCYYGMGHYEMAEQYYLEALKIARSILDDAAPTYSSLLNNLGLLYNTTGRYEEAEQLYLEVVEMDRKSNSAHHYATSLNNLAVLYQEMGHYEAAKKLYLQSQKLRKEIYGVDHVNYALGLNNIGNLYEAMNQNFEAEAYYKEVRKRLSAHSPHYVHSLNASAKLYFKQKKYKQAEDFWLKALKISRVELGEKHPSTAQYWDQLANLYLAKGEEEKALDYCRKGLLANMPELEAAAFVDWKQLDTTTYYSNERARASLSTLLDILKSSCSKTTLKRKWEEYFTVSNVAMRLNERIRNDFTSTANKLRILENNITSLGCGIHAAVFLGGTAYYEQAFAFAEQNKSILLIEALKGQQARALGDLPDSLALLESSLQQQQESLWKKKIVATSKEEQTAIAIEMNQLNFKIGNFVTILENKYPQYHDLKYNNSTVSVEEVQASLKPKTLLLEYFILEDLTYLFTISKEEIDIIPIPHSKTKLNEYINSLRLSLSAYDLIDEAPKEAYLLYIKSAEWLYQELLKKTLKDQKIEDLIIVTDGALGHIPFEVFLTKPAPQKGTNYKDLDYLVKDYNISYSYSASLWKENLKQSASSLYSSFNHEILAFAASYPKPQHSLFSLRSENICRIRSALEDLPAATKEVKGLSKMFYGQFLTGAEANEANFKKLAPNYSVIHLAMHGVSNEVEPILSSLAFSEDYQTVEDNFLQAYEVAQMPLHANLVVLSACETGYGKFQQGEGVISLARSFMYAGVPSVVVSLWQVNDQATAIIMRLFYQNMAKGMSKSRALRMAKLSYLEKFEGMAAHPALWSAFIQIGDSAAIELETKKQWYWWFIGGIVISFLIVIIIIGYRKHRHNRI